MRKKKIITITTSGLARKEGISTVILDYYSRLDKNKYDFHIIASGEYCYELIHGLEQIGITIQYLPSRRSLPLSYYSEFIKLMKKERYDAIYIHGSSAIMSIELCIAKQFGCNIRISHSHNTQCDHKVIDRLLRPLFYRVVTHSVACGKEAGKWLYGDKPFVILRNGREPADYRYDDMIRKRVRDKIRLDEACIAIGHVGNFNEQKNQKFLVDVFQELIKIHPNSKMFLMGDGRKREEVLLYSDKKDLSDKIYFTGNVDNVPEMLQAMDVMVLPSIHEGVPLVVIEWQMSGLPSVISDKVTTECAYTDLVYFKSLDDTFYSWANLISKLATIKCNRNLQSKNAVEAAEKVGFDINTDVTILDNILSSEG